MEVEVDGQMADRSFAWQEPVSSSQAAGRFVRSKTWTGSPLRLRNQELCCRPPDALFSVAESFSDLYVQTDQCRFTRNAQHGHVRRGLCQCVSG